MGHNLLNMQYLQFRYSIMGTSEDPIHMPDSAMPSSSSKAALSWSSWGIRSSCSLPSSTASRHYTQQHYRLHVYQQDCPPNLVTILTKSKFETIIFIKQSDCVKLKFNKKLFDGLVLPRVRIVVFSIGTYPGLNKHETGYNFRPQTNSQSNIDISNPASTTLALQHQHHKNNCNNANNFLDLIYNITNSS